MKHRYLKNVVTLQLNDDKCTGCGMCLNVCPHDVLGSAGKKFRLSTGMPVWNAVLVLQIALLMR